MAHKHFYRLKHASPWHDITTYYFVCLCGANFACTKGWLWTGEVKRVTIW